MSQNRTAVSLTVLEIQRQKWTDGRHFTPSCRDKVNTDVLLLLVLITRKLN